jgi:pyruvate kinase
MPQSLDTLIARLDGLLEDLVRAEAEHADVIDAVAEEHRRGAVNLVHYTTLRQHDRRELQNDLMDIGATSLATAEAHVQAKVRAARNVLAALRGDTGPWHLDAIDDALDQGDEILNTNAEAVFGPMRPGRPTRIMVTLPSEAADDPELVAAFADAGMDAARINCAHDGPTTWARMAGNIRAAAYTAGRQILVSMDLPGPKLRTGPIVDGPAVGRARVTRNESGRVLAPARIWLTPVDAPTPPPAPIAPATRLTLAVQVEAAWLADRRPGDVLTLHDVRGCKRTFTLTDVGAGGALAEGRRNTYLTDGAKLSCDAAATTAAGIPPLTRRLSLAAGDRLVLTGDLTPVEPPAAGQVARIGCTLPEAIAAMRPGDPVLLDDGAITAVVESVTPGEASLRIKRTKPGGGTSARRKASTCPTPSCH